MSSILEADVAKLLMLLMPLPPLLNIAAVGGCCCIHSGRWLIARPLVMCSGAAFSMRCACMHLQFSAAVLSACCQRFAAELAAAAALAAAASPSSKPLHGTLSAQPRLPRSPRIQCLCCPG
jgi:hypothetical protein